MPQASAGAGMTNDPKPWLKSYPSGMPPGLDYPREPLFHFLQESAARYPDRAAIIYQDPPVGETATKTYRELDEDSSRFAAGLVSLGVNKGDRVACYIRNSPELITGFYGILKAGAVPVPCNAMYRAEELAYRLKDSGATVLLCEAALYPTARQVIPETVISHVIAAGGAVKDDVDDLINWDDLLASNSPLAVFPSIDVDMDLALLPFTGGTTGVPKGTMLTHSNMVANTVQFRDWFGYESGKEIFIAALPLFHIGGIAGVMNVPLAAAGTIVLFRRFDPERVLQAIQSYRATRFLGVPTMYIALLNHEATGDYDLTSLRPSRTSAAPLPKAVKESFNELVGHEVLVEGYGLTETSPLTHANPVDAARAGSIGLPLPDTEARIFDPDVGTEEMPLGEIGELVLRGPQVMKGYWNRPRETGEAIRNGWFYTGDLAYMDERGYFFIVDRKKDVINAAGFKVWPREVEETLYQHPSIRMAAVLGVPDDYRGETVKAVIALKEAHGFATEELARQDILALCRQRLANYKIPRIVDFRDELPVSAAGKVLRRVLRDEATETE